jgi:hypothetical protein
MSGLVICAATPTLRNTKLSRQGLMNSGISGLNFEYSALLAFATRQKKVFSKQTSWDDMSKNDLPSMVDHILTVTGESKISYIGHSQVVLDRRNCILYYRFLFACKLFKGTLIGFAQFGMNQILASRIKIFIGLVCHDDAFSK